MLFFLYMIYVYLNLVTETVDEFRYVMIGWLPINPN